MKIRHYRNNKNSSIIGLLLMLLLCGCQPNVKEKLAAAEKRVKLAKAKRNYSPPLDDYYPAMKEWMYWYQQLNSSDQLVKASFIYLEEGGCINSMVRSFRNCYFDIRKSALSSINDAYPNKITEEEWTAASIHINEWTSSLSDTTIILCPRLDSLITALEMKHQYFQKNCERWQLHIDYLREEYGVEVSTLPCDIESIKENHRIHALDRVEYELKEEFHDSLLVVLTRKNE